MKWLCVFSLLAALLPVRADDFPSLNEPLKTVVTNYLVVQQKLAGDSFDGVTTAANGMKTAMSGLNARSFQPDFIAAVDKLASTTDLHGARLAFQDVSNDLIAALAQAQAKTGSLHVAFCPMVKAYWVQNDDKAIKNPYFGSSMLDCGSFQRQF